MADILDSGIKLVKNVARYNIGRGSVAELGSVLDQKRRESGGQGGSSGVVFLIDEFFRDDKQFLQRLGVSQGDALRFIRTEHEPTTDGIDDLIRQLSQELGALPAAIVGVGGGTTMDSAKAVSNLFTNGGRAADYQGWDLVTRPGVFKIGIPTLSGTGAEATRTCVMINPANGLKLGMNSDFTVFDHVIMDPDLTATVARNQYFFSGMDAYIHCVEALSGSYRNAIGDAYSRETLNLCRSVFLEGDMMSDSSREKMMVASFLGGCAIATSYVGLVHPLSAGLSVVLGLHHCVANCIVMRAMGDYYPQAYDEFWEMASRQGVEIPSGVCRDLDDEGLKALYNASVIHQKPLTNALGVDFKSVLTFEKVSGLFRTM